MRPDSVGSVIAAAAMAMVAACSTSPASEPAQPDASPEAASSTPGPLLAQVGDFSEFPNGKLPKATTIDLQRILDDAVAQGTFTGGTAAVAVAGAGTWSGAAGVSEGARLTPDSLLDTASVAKTITTAAVLRLAEQGIIDLDDPAADHLPPGHGLLESSNIRIRDLLGMRSGLSDPYSYEQIATKGGTAAAVLGDVGKPKPAGADIEYANINFLLLGEVVEHLTGRPFARAARAVLDQWGLARLVYGESGAVAADGFMVTADTETLVRWGYHLYGGHVLSAASLREMTEFQGEWYGLGTIDFTHPDTGIVFDTPAVGHGGQSHPYSTIMIAFPETDSVVSIQADTDNLESLGPVAAELRNAAQR